MDLDALKKDIIELSHQVPLSFAYLFGSRAKGNASQKSDYDFAFYVKDYSPEKELDIGGKIITFLQSRLHTNNIDIKILNNMYDEILLSFHIIKDGIPLYDNEENLRNDFELRVSRRYKDRRWYWERNSKYNK